MASVAELIDQIHIASGMEDTEQTFCSLEGSKSKTVLNNGVLPALIQGRPSETVQLLKEEGGRHSWTLLRSP